MSLLTIGLQIEVLLPLYNLVLEIRVCSNPSPVSQFLYLLKYPREIIYPTSQETVGRHVKPSLPVVVMATLNQFNSNLFCGFSKQ